jgi:hypothetical protein
MECLVSPRNSLDILVEKNTPAGNIMISAKGKTTTGRKLLLI